MRSLSRPSARLLATGKYAAVGLMAVLSFSVGERALRGAAGVKAWQDGEVLTARDLNANFSLLATQMPAKAIVQAYLSSAEVGASFDGTGLGIATGAYAGWALCNGKNGTPDLGGRFVRVNNAAAGATGGSDTMAHTHAIDHDHPAFGSAAEAAHTHALPAHQHYIPLGFDRDAAYLTGDDNGTGNPAFGSRVFRASRAAIDLTQAYGDYNTRQALTEASGAGSSGAGSAHAHTVDPPAFAGTSGPASNVDNRPAFYELVALMRL